MLPLLPEVLRKHVKPFTLRGMRNYSIKVPVDTCVITEVRGIWSDSLKSGLVTGPNSCELYVTLQKSPEQRVKYSVMGRLLEFVKSKQDFGDYDFKPFWAPDFSIYAVRDGERPTLVAYVDDSGQVSWEAGCEAVLGEARDAIEGQFAVYRRK